MKSLSGKTYLEKPQQNNSKIFVCLLLLYIVIIYSNTLQTPFLLDDRVNIVERPNLHLSILTVKNVANTFFAGEANNRYLHRPLSSLSLALNYYVGRFNVAGYHVVNLSIHLIAAVFLYKILILLLGLKKFNFSNIEINCIAGLATILWAAHPIQTQAVTYMIQRMASLSAMFYVIGLWFYLKFRCPEKYANGKLSLFFSGLFFCCAILSKESAVIFPLGIFCIELFFFEGYKKIKASPLRFSGVLCIVLIIPVLFFLQTSSLEQIFSGYDYRPFTLKQRLLTEPRVLFFYISQLLYPIPGRFSISHSFLLSDSLFSPLSTCFSIAGLLCAFGLAVFRGSKYPLLGFSIIFYLAHHLIESTFIPLELVYEHRNYLPSLFFFLPISLGVVKLLLLYKKQKNNMFFIVFAFCSSLIFLIGVSTYLRNNAWRSHEALWTSAAATSPDLIRPYSQLGWPYTNKNRTDVNKALFYFEQGLDKNPSYHLFEKVFLWLNIARTYGQANDFLVAKNASLNCLNAFQKELGKKPSLNKNDSSKATLSSIYQSLARNYFYLNDIPKALFHINKAIELQGIPAFYIEKARYLIVSVKGLNPRLIGG